MFYREDNDNDNDNDKDNDNNISVIKCHESIMIKENWRLQ